jgi:hypothetical protein
LNQGLLRIYKKKNEKSKTALRLDESFLFAVFKKQDRRKNLKLPRRKAIEA